MKKEIFENSKNYTCLVIKTKDVTKHPNADKLMITQVMGNNVICGLDTVSNEIYLYFPLECCLSPEFLTANDLLRRKNPITGVTEGGMFDPKGRVRCIKLRGEKSEGFLAPLTYLSFLKVDIDLKEGDEFNALNGIKICEKYVVRKDSNLSNLQSKKDKVKRFDRLVDNQVRLHVDTIQLKRYIDNLEKQDFVGIHYKKHGTSFWVGNLLVKRKLNLIEKVLSKLGLLIQTTEYDYIYGSRKVIKNKYIQDSKNHFYDYDIWADIKDRIKDVIPKGFTIYGEAIGYTKTGGYIQDNFDYGCQSGEFKVYVYRVTYTNPDGKVFELSDLQIKEFCNSRSLNYEDTFMFYGRVEDLFKSLLDKYNLSELPEWKDQLLKLLQMEYTEKDCYMCKNNVPEEGIILRRDKLSEYEAFKLKSFRFLDYETKQLDKEIVNIEE